ncbi:MAG: hypothetical protein RBU45_26085, partial [Myxococcota bacterium]|nr:hypothetical protein [Myxococcota bacterium]
MPVPELVTQTEFGRRVGVSRQRIGALISAGRLPLDPRTKRIPWVEGKAVFDADRMDGSEVAAPDMTTDEAAEITHQPPPVLRPAVDLDSAAAVASQHAKARAADKVWQARTRELRYQTLRGTLVERAEVDADSENVAALIRSTLLALPGKLAPQLSGRVLEIAEVEALLVAEVEAALAHLYESR